MSSGQKLKLFNRVLGLSLIGIAVLGPFISVLGQGSNWPQWRGPGGRGVSEETNLPSEWSPTKNILWKSEIPGRGHSSPVVWEKRIFLTTSIEGAVVPGKEAIRHIYKGDDPRFKGQEYRHPDSMGSDHKYALKVLCIDADTGKVIWEQQAYEGTVYDNRHKKNTYASTTVATDGKYVFVSFEAEGFYCYDFDGKLIWKTSLGKIAKFGLGPGTSPILYENSVILQCDQEFGETSFMVALDKNTGKELWKTRRSQPKTWATPVLIKTANRTELVTSGSDNIISYDPANGKELWRSDGIESNPIPSPVYGHDMVFVMAGSDAKRAVGIKLGGKGDISKTQNVVWRFDKGAPYVPSPILYGDYLYIMSDGGVISCLEAVTGKVQYQGRIPVPATFTSSPVAYEGKVVFTSEDGDSFVFRAGPKADILGTSSLGEPVYASPAISNGRIYIRGAQHLFCITNVVGK